MVFCESVIPIIDIDIADTLQRCQNLSAHNTSSMRGLVTPRSLVCASAGYSQVSVCPVWLISGRRVKTISDYFYHILFLRDHNIISVNFVHSKNATDKALLNSLQFNIRIVFSCRKQNLCTGRHSNTMSNDNLCSVSIYWTKLASSVNIMAGTLIKLSHYGTFHNNEEVQMAIRKQVGMQEQDFYGEGIFKRATMWQTYQCAECLCWKIITFQWD